MRRATTSRCSAGEAPLALALALALVAAAAIGGVGALSPGGASGPPRREGESLEAPIRIERLPGCGSEGSLEPATECDLELSLPGAGAARWLTFAIAPDVSLEMTVTLTARTSSGSVDLALWLPGESATAAPPSQRGTNAGYNLTAPGGQRPPASDTDYIFLRGRDMVVPGVFTVLVSANTGTPRVRLRLSAASAITRANDDELKALGRLLAACCPRWNETSGGANASASAGAAGAEGWCGPMGRAMLAPSEDFSADPCHVPPNVCTTDGRLQQLILPAAGLDCGGAMPEVRAPSPSLLLNLDSSFLRRRPTNHIHMITINKKQNRPSPRSRRCALSTCRTTASARPPRRSAPSPRACPRSRRSCCAAPRCRGR